MFIATFFSVHPNHEQENSSITHAHLYAFRDHLGLRPLRGREARILTPAMAAAMKGLMYSLREKEAKALELVMYR